MPVTVPSLSGLSCMLLQAAVMLTVYRIRVYNPQRIKPRPSGQRFAR